ncbi:hypothetical protein PIB30_020188 [Stylosanthes scabra]|uniref:Uncharacterized protein n=1 Tax=Stylosanthes scabra TaxID=79078 RepID=A0ABU6Q8F7_9FABA|nr:hypothetical protein [Stylosanthes scabra]
MSSENSPHSTPGSATVAASKSAMDTAAKSLVKNRPRQFPRRNRLRKIPLPKKKSPQKKKSQMADRLIEMEPEELDWPLLKAHLRAPEGEHPIVRSLFEEVLKRDPYNVIALHRFFVATFELKIPINQRKIFAKV